MHNVSFRHWVRQRLRNTLHHSAKQLNGVELSRSATIFSPHPDDETLACGGTIIKKKAAGADIKIVYMTDGSQSHPHFSHIISPDELKQIRENEALAATRMLGVSEQDIRFLRFQDGHLKQHHDEAIQKISEFLQDHHSDQLFIPYKRDQTPDHLATNKIVLSALNTLQQSVTVYEYPIWIWHLWPWTNPFDIASIGSRRQIMVNQLISALGLRFLLDFRHSVYIKDVINKKQDALAQHKSQMTKLVSDSNWLTLADVADGEWLANFFQEVEIFSRYQS